MGVIYLLFLQRERNQVDSWQGAGSLQPSQINLLQCDRFQR